MRILLTGGAGFIGSVLARHVVIGRGADAQIDDMCINVGERLGLRSGLRRPAAVA